MSLCVFAGIVISMFIKASLINVFVLFKTLLREKRCWSLFGLKKSLKSLIVSDICSIVFLVFFEKESKACLSALPLLNFFSSAKRLRESELRGCLHWWAMFPIISPILASLDCWNIISWLRMISVLSVKPMTTPYSSLEKRIRFIWNQ